MSFYSFVQLILCVTILQSCVNAAVIKPARPTGKPTEVTTRLSNTTSGTTTTTGSHSTSQTEIKGATPTESSQVTGSPTDLNQCALPAGTRIPIARSPPTYGGYICNGMVQVNTVWHLAWISQPDISRFHWAPNDLIYQWPIIQRWGSGVVVYVIDSGVDSAHNAFAPHQVESGASVSGLAKSKNNPHKDEENHGTGVASLIAGQLNGIAHAATIYPIKTPDNTLLTIGAHSKNIAEALNIAVKNWKPRFAANPKLRAVINVSMWVPQSKVTQAALELAIKSGIHVVMAAGNHGTNMCLEDGLVSVAGSEVKKVGQTLVSLSAPGYVAAGVVGEDIYHRGGAQGGHGSCIDIFAPGHLIPVALAGKRKDYNTFTGASYSAAIVSGTYAALLSSHATATRNLSPPQLQRLVLQKFSRKVYHVPKGTTDKTLDISKLWSPF